MTASYNPNSIMSVPTELVECEWAAPIEFIEQANRGLQNPATEETEDEQTS